MNISSSASFKCISTSTPTIATVAKRANRGEQKTSTAAAGSSSESARPRQRNQEATHGSND